MKRTLTVLSLVGLAAQVSLANVVYQQTPFWAGSGTQTGSIWTSQADASVSGYRSFDNFTLSASALINQASWLGVYLNSSDLSDGAPNTDTWSIRFYDDNAGAPGNVLQSTTLLSTDVAVAVLGTGLVGSSTVTVYQFTANLNSFNGAAGVQYWFSPLSRAANFDPLFAWMQGLGGDNLTYQTGFTNGTVNSATFQGGDRAFSLATVPEPATFGLLGFALAVALVTRRRLTR